MAFVPVCFLSLSASFSHEEAGDRTHGFPWPCQRSVWTDPMFIRSPADGLWVVAKVWLMRMVLHERLCTVSGLLFAIPWV